MRNLKSIYIEMTKKLVLYKNESNSYFINYYLKVKHLSKR